MNIIIKRLFLLVSVISSFLNANASKDIDLLNSLFEYQNKGGYTDNQKLGLLQMLRGDTIVFDFDGIEKTSLFSTATPDTIWIKKKPKKNPVEGKHYKLHYVYKGVADEIGDYYTPVSEIIGKQFSVISVTTQSTSSYYSDYKNYIIQLVDIENLDVVKCTIPLYLSYNISITSCKVNRIINSLIDKVFYIRTSNDYSLNKIYYRTILQNSNFRILFSGTLKEFKVLLNLDFISDDGIKVPYNRHGSDMILTESDYIAYKDSISPRCINSVLNDSIFSNKIEMPFQFTFIMGLVSGYSSKISQEIDPTENYSDGLQGYNTLPSGSVVLIADKFSIKDKSYYKALFNGKAFFINAKNIKLTDDMNIKLDSLLLCNQEQKDFFFHNSLFLSKHMYSETISELATELSSYKKHGLAIRDWSVYDESEYTDGTSIRFDFYNPTSKTIKYITINFVGYNAVDDPVSSRGSYTLNRKCIGPIEPEETASYAFEYAWFTDIVEYAKIKSIVVQYKDGTSKTITNAKQITFSTELEKFLSSSNPVADFE